MRGKYLRILCYCRCTNLHSFKTVRANANNLLKRTEDSSSAIVGLVRTYGIIVPDEQITLNAICPQVVRTGISKHTPWFYDELEKRGLLVDVGRVVDGFEEFMGGGTRSAGCYVVGPKRSRVVQFMDYMDDDTKEGCDAANARSGRLWKDS